MEAAQEPRIRISPKYVSSAGPDAGELAAAYGLTPDPWQQLVLDDWLGETKDGKLAAGSAALAVSRQNGKNAIIEVVELFKMTVQGRAVLHTAHEVKTARKAFLRISSFFENERKYPDLAALVKEIRKTNGQEAIILTNGGSVEFVARSRGSGRGFTVDDLVLDEVQELTDEQLEALLPTISSAPSGDPQQIYTGTPPAPTAVAEVFPRLRESVTSGKAKRVAWVEWSIPDDSDPEEAVKAWKQNAYATNPALGRRLNIQTVQDEVAAMSPEGICRERFGWWESMAAGKRAIDPAKWSALKVEPEDAVQDGRLCFAVKFSPDGSHVSLAFAVRPDAGLVHVESIRLESMSEGTEWLRDFLVEHHREAAQIVIDGKFGVGFLVNALKDAGVRNKRLIIVPTVPEVIAAHSMFDRSVAEAGVTTIQQDEVDTEIRGAMRREIGKDGGFGWEAPEGESVLRLEAMTLAHWAAKTTKRRPGSGARGMVTS